MIASKQGPKVLSKKPSKKRIAQTGGMDLENAKPNDNYISPIIFVTYSSPSDHRAGEQLGNWETPDELRRKRFTAHDANPEHGTGHGVVLAACADVLAPSHDTGRTERALVECLHNIHETHER